MTYQVLLFVSCTLFFATLAAPIQPNSQSKDETANTDFRFRQDIAEETTVGPFVGETTEKEYTDSPELNRADEEGLSELRKLLELYELTLPPDEESATNEPPGGDLIEDVEVIIDHSVLASLAGGGLG